MAPINAGDPNYLSKYSKYDPPSSSQQSGFSGKCVTLICKKKHTPWKINIEDNNAGLFKIIFLCKGSDF